MSELFITMTTHSPTCCHCPEEAPAPATDVVTYRTRNGEGEVHLPVCKPCGRALYAQGWRFRRRKESMELAS